MEPQERDEIVKVIREVIAQEIDTAFERQATLIQREFQAISKRITGVETRLSNLETRLTGLETRVGKLEDQYRLTSRRLDNLDSAIGDIRTDVRTLRDYVVERSEDTQAQLAEMKNSVAQLEEELQQIKRRISKLEGS